VDLAGDEPSQRCAALAILSAVLLQQGDLLGAIAAGEDANRNGIGDGAHREAWRALSEAYVQAGRFDDALRMLINARDSRLIERKQPDPRSSAGDAVCMARVYLAGKAAGVYGPPHLAAARRLLDEAIPAFRNDRRGSLACDAVQAWMLAEEGKAEAAVGLVADIDRRRQSYQPNNRAMLVDCLEVYAFVSFLLGGHKQSAAYWQQRAKLANPIARPQSLYWLARCLEAMGDNRAADIYERTAGIPIDSVWTHKACTRAAELSRPQPVPVPAGRS